jgi:hypothetical protein
MPDVISNVQTMNLNRVDDFMEEENGSINHENQMLSHHLNHHNNNSSNLLNLDPLLSAASSNHHSTVDMTALDPLLNNYGILSMHVHQVNCDNGSVESILPSDSDSLISDIDMVA